MINSLKEELKKKKKEKNFVELISPKENLIANLFSVNLLYFQVDPFNKLLSNYSQIENLLNLNDQSIIKYFYIERKKINKILYEEEKVIYFKNKDEKIENLNYYFYLDLLINENRNIINYGFPLNFILKIDNEQKNINGIYTKLFIAKIIIDLINVYQESDDYNEENEEQILKAIKSESEKAIKTNMHHLNEINLKLNEKEFLSKKIDELYSNIIISLIINEKLENYNFAYNIIKQLDLENIDITETIFISLHKILDKDSKCIDKYIIKKKEDLLEEKNINFYYFLLKYILKNSFYIYNIPLLFKLRKFILNLIKSKEFIYSELEEENKNKLKYIFKTLADSEYYLNIDRFINQLTEILKYYKDFQFISKKEDINFLQDIINNKKEGFEKYLKDYEVAQKTNIRASIIKYLINSEEQEVEKNEDILKENINSWNIYEDLIKKKAFKKKMKKNIKQLLVNYFIKEENEETLLKIFNKEEIHSFIKENKNFIPIYKAIVEEKDNSNNEQKINFNSDISTKNKISLDYNNKNKENENTFKDKFYFEIIDKLLKKCIIFIHINKKGNEPFLNYGPIYIGEKNIEIAYEQLPKKNNNIRKNKLYEDYMKFLDFLKEIEDGLKNKYINNNELDIKLELNKECIKNDTESSLYSISCKYSLLDQVSKKIKNSYEDKNILANGAKVKDFYSLLKEINSSKNQNLECFNKLSNKQKTLNKKISSPSSTNCIKIKEENKEKIETSPIKVIDLKKVQTTRYIINPNQKDIYLILSSRDNI